MAGINGDNQSANEVSISGAPKLRRLHFSGSCNVAALRRHWLFVYSDKCSRSLVSTRDRPPVSFLANPLDWHPPTRPKERKSIRKSDKCREADELLHWTIDAVRDAAAAVQVGVPFVNSFHLLQPTRVRNPSQRLRHHTLRPGLPSAIRTPNSPVMAAASGPIAHLRPLIWISSAA